MSDTGGTPADPREAAIASLKTKRAFQISLGIYLAVNAMLVVIWALTRDEGDGAGFWPIWSIAFWGIGVAIQGWHAYGPRWAGISEDKIQQEMQRQHGR
jgi:hypothetical protein